MINFRQYPNLTKIIIPNKITLTNNNFSNAFSTMRKLTSSSFNHPNVTNMSFAYEFC
jgi:hypothetical protein